MSWRWQLRMLLVRYGVKYCDERVCVFGVFVSLSDSISLELHVQLSPDYLHVTYGHGSVHLRRRCDSLFTYLLPVLWMTSYLHIMAKNRRCDISVYSNWLNRGQHGFVSAAHTENDASGSGAGAESDIYDCSVVAYDPLREEIGSWRELGGSSQASSYRAYSDYESSRVNTRLHHSQLSWTSVLCVVELRSLSFVSRLCSFFLLFKTRTVMSESSYRILL